MEYRKLGHTDIQVSSICLGTMTWGSQNTEAEAHTQLDYALERGVNFIDTAEMYAVPPSKETYTLTEQYIGSWLKNRQDRDKIILATKIAGRSPRMTWVRDGKNQFDRQNIEAAIDGSLKRLQTDYIDLYQLHWPDRITNFFGQLGYPYVNKKDESVPILETLQVLADLVEKGKVRHIGLSNETPWGLMQFLQEAERHNLPRPVSIQNPYNLLNRTYEIGLSEITHREGVGLLAYSPMAFGVLSGKYINGAMPEGSRIALYGGHFKRYTNEQALAATESYVKLARENNLTPAQLSLGFVTTRPFVTSNIIGATNIDQLKENIDTFDIEIPKPLMKEIEKIHTNIPNPSP